jgi:hypothetical protein
MMPILPVNLRAASIAPPAESDPLNPIKAFLGKSPGAILTNFFARLTVSVFGE